jgi:hypothetical protein
MNQMLVRLIAATGLSLALGTALADDPPAAAPAAQEPTAKEAPAPAEAGQKSVAHPADAIEDLSSPAGPAAARDADAAARQAASKEELICGYETATGSRYARKVCRRKTDVESESREVERTMNRTRHYGNPTVTPGG